MLKFSGRAASFITLKCSVLTPVVLGSVPELLEGRSSARRKPVWMLSGEGAKMDLSVMVTSTGMLAVSNYIASVNT